MPSAPTIAASETADRMTIPTRVRSRTRAMPDADDARRGQDEQPVQRDTGSRRTARSQSNPAGTGTWSGLLPQIQRTPSEIMKKSPKVNSSSYACPKAWVRRSNHRSTAAPSRPITTGATSRDEPEAPGGLDGRVGHVRPQHVEGGMGDVQDAHHAEHQRQPRGDEEQQHAVDEAVEPLGGVDGEREHAGVRPDNQRTQPQDTNT